MEKAASTSIPFWQWLPYVIAVGLMALGIYQARQLAALKTELVTVSADDVKSHQSNALMGLRLTTLEAKDTAYLSTKVVVAWDPYLHRGVISLQNLPPPPPGHDYQLWVLDPAAEAPISAGLIPTEPGSRRFAVRPVSTDRPGFAISLEPSGGGPAPTGAILFAVEPGD